MYKDIYRKCITLARDIYIYKYKCVVYDSVCLIYVDNECKYEKNVKMIKKDIKKTYK